ncbi:sugar transporter st1 [Cystoisospora suis]|uniref:Hexose transporter 1 n=1 Tax=Cystoisospora suis TaxID=483139 RepID=A0A2C6KXY2_9APIC|nr:sugar transporter st1 [Cystoisospora suis]
MSDRIGRKPGLALSDVCLLVGSIAMGTGQAFWVTLFGRFVVGMGVGLGFVVYATYTSEVAPPDRRGQLVACQEVAQCFGCLVAYAMAAACGEKAWRYLLGMGGILAAVQILGEVLILPESPRFFVQHGREDDAAASLRKLGMTDPVAVAAVIEEFKAEREQYGDLSGGLEERRTWKASWRQQFEKMQCYRGSLLIAVGCAVAQNFTAANSVIYFTIDIFRLASICDPLLPGVGVGIVKFAGVVVCLFFVDRWGRRFLLLTGTAGTLLCHILMATGFALQEGGMPLAAAAACGGGIEQSSPPYAKLLIVALLIYIFFWNTSWAALMFVVASEVLPNSLRGLGMGLTITTFWIFSFIMQSALEPLFSAITIPGKLVHSRSPTGVSAAMSPDAVGRSSLTWFVFRPCLVVLDGDEVAECLLEVCSA